MKKNNSTEEKKHRLRDGLKKHRKDKKEEDDKKYAKEEEEDPMTQEVRRMRREAMSKANTKDLNIEKKVEESKKRDKKNLKESKKKIILICIVCIVFMVVELGGGIIAHSLAILTDAAHMFSDLMGFVIGFIALKIAAKGSNKKRTYGYHRAQILGSVFSVVLIWALTVWLVVEAITRLINPESVNGPIMLGIAIFGLLSNILMSKLLHSHKDEHHDKEDKDKDSTSKDDKNKVENEKECNDKESLQKYKTRKCRSDGQMLHKQIDQNNCEAKEFLKREFIGGNNEVVVEGAQLNTERLKPAFKVVCCEGSDIEMGTRTTSEDALCECDDYNNHANNEEDNEAIILDTEKNNDRKQIQHHHKRDHRKPPRIVNAPFNFFKHEITNFPKLNREKHHSYNFIDNGDAKKTNSKSNKKGGKDKKETNSGDKAKGGKIKQSLESLKFWKKNDAKDKSSNNNPNVRAAFIHVLGDIIQSIGVIIAAVIITAVPSAHYVDPICTFLFSILIVLTTVRIMKDNFRVLMEAFPEDVDMDELLKDIKKIEGVMEIHDLHVWSLTAGKNALSVHIVCKKTMRTLEEVTHLLKDKYEILHTTIQVEKLDKNQKLAYLCLNDVD